jgi:LmbE family N-acetylglucosaminyl deacetylase
MMKSAIAISAHPDDIEFLMAGTLILLKDAGYEIHCMTIANGSCGSAELDAETIAAIRREETKAAAESIGAAFHESLVNDIEIFYEKGLLAEVASVIREVAPEIVLTHSPEDYMEDHVNAARLAATAAFCRNMPNFPVAPPRPPIEGDIAVYHAQPHGNRDTFGNLVGPSIFVDIGDVLDQKAEALSLHKSQKEWLDRTQGMDSYVNAMRELCAEVGGMSEQFEFAEGWRKRNSLGFAPADFDPLSDSLREFVAFR